MRYLVLSDIHANPPALEAVLASARARGWDEVIFLGDAVGYYTRPQRVLDMLIELDPTVRIVGNHDALLLALADGDAQAAREGGLVREVVARHLEEVTDDGLAFLRTFERHRTTREWEATHGALRHRWEYITSVQSAQGNLDQLETRLCLVGHTHVPRAYVSASADGRQLWRTVGFAGDQQVYRVPPRARGFLNPGSVGQPRDGNPDAAYAFFDDERMTFEVVRVGYEVAKMQREVQDFGYPDALAARLAVGR